MHAASRCPRGRRRRRRSGRLRAATAASCSAAAAKPAAGCSTADALDATRGERVGNCGAPGRAVADDDARGRLPATGCGPPSANAVPSAGSPPPLLACAASAGASTAGPNDSSTASSEPTSSVRATSSRRGGTTHATSAPLENMIWPRAHDENVSPARYAPIGTEVLGRRHGAEPQRHPAGRRVARCGPGRRLSRQAPSTMRVAAIGDSALTVTPAGASCPMRHVSAATARFAQLYAPASAGRHPEPDVTPRMRPWPAAVMSGSAARSTLR